MKATAKRYLSIVAASFAALAATPASASKPVFLVGDPGELELVKADVSDVIPIRTELEKDGKWIDPARYGEAAAVLFGETVKMGSGKQAWTDKAGATALTNYLANGGCLVFTGVAWEQLSTNATPEVAELLSFPVPPGGETFAEKKALAGTIFCCTQSIASIRRYCRDNKISLGDADGEGNWVPSNEGERLAALTREYDRVFRRIPGTDDKVDRRDWGIKPLGPIAKGKPDDTLRNKPVFAKSRPNYRPGLKVLSPGSKAYIVCEKTIKVNGRESASQYLANELNWYLKAMSGLEAEVVPIDEKKRGAFTPQPEDVCVFVSDRFLAKEVFGIDYDKHPVGTSFLRRKGNWFLIAGERSGASHALTYLLETMGCRYLWPGDGGSGKIVPKKSEIVFPDFGDWTYTPAVKHRGIRTPIPNAKQFREGNGKSAAKHGQDADAFREEIIKYRSDFDLPGTNRDFYAWHGVSDRDSLDGDYAWGHYFKDYYDKYSAEHPEFFALQPNGSRDQSKVLGKKHERATLCLSCPGLVEVTASNLVARFAQLPTYKALSISLPDAGGAQQCMCENCRRLDPPNARIYSVKVGSDAKVPYPAMTDRVIWFANQVAAIVKKSCPDKKLCFYAYNSYTPPPFYYKPDPMLVVLTVCGDYSRAGNATGNFASWANFGIPTYWRPNLLWGFRTVSPQNFARRLFNDLEMMKANNLEGTDFDCYYDQWAEFGYVYYMLSKALMNPDRLDFDTISDDYLASGFGPAAKAMKKYYDLLEKHFVACAETPWTERHGWYSYTRKLDIDALQRCFDEARSLAAGDDAVLRRIAHFEIGLVPARFEKAIVAAYDAGDREGVKAAQAKFREWIDTEAPKHISAVNPVRYWDSYKTPCFSVRW